MNKTVKLDGKEYLLFPIEFLDMIGSKILEEFNLGKHHSIVVEMYAQHDIYSQRGIFYIDTKKGKEQPAYALTKKEMEFLKTNYERSQQVF